MNSKWSIAAAIVASPFLIANPSTGQPVDLGTAGDFAILTKSGITAAGATSIAGDIGVSPIASGAITGFALALDPSGTFSTSSFVTGRVFAADYASPTPGNLTTAVSNMEAAYADAMGRAADVTGLNAGSIGGLVIAPGVYNWGTGVDVMTDVTLAGGPTDVWIFQIAGTLVVSSDVQVVLSGGARADNVFWQVAGQTTLGTDSEFRGVILDATAIVMNGGARLDGRALAQTAVTMGVGVGVEPLCEAPVSGCNTAAKGVFRLKDDPIDAKDKFRWKFKRSTGPIDKLTELGDPVTGATGYAVCVWDRTGGVASLASMMLVEAGGTCAGRPCWKNTARPVGVRYTNQPANASGFVSIVGRSGSAGQGNVIVRGSGASLPMPTPFSATEMFDQDTEVVVQMHALDSGACWESVFGTGTATRNTGRVFKAVTP